MPLAKDEFQTNWLKIIFWPQFLVTCKCYFTCLCSLRQTTSIQMIYYMIDLLQDQSLPLGINRSSSRSIIASWHWSIFFGMDHCLLALIDPLQDWSLTLGIDRSSLGWITASRHWSILCKIDHWLSSIIQIALFNVC